MEAIGWVSWGLVLIWALLSSLNIRRIMRHGDFPSPPKRLASLSLWALAIIFVFVAWPKVHMLWLAPSCVLVFRWGQIIFPWPFYPLLPVTRAYACILAIDIDPPERPVSHQGNPED